MHLGQYFCRIGQLRERTGRDKRCRLNAAHTCIDQAVNRRDLVGRRDKLWLCLETVTRADFSDRHKIFRLR